MDQPPWTGSPVPNQPPPEPGAPGLPPPRGVAPGPSASRWPLVVIGAFFGVVAIVAVVATIMDQPRPLHPDCAAAERCCLAAANATPPVPAASLQRCVEIATSAAEACADNLAVARSDALRAEVSCSTSAVKAYGSYRWTEQASTVHTAPDQRPPGRELYSRVSCRQAADALVAAVQQQRDGPWLVIRPLELVIVALSLNDPDAVIYCDGFPLPITTPQQADRTRPIHYRGGPHAVLLRPERSGQFRVRQYCLGCNRVGQEPPGRRR